MTHQILVKLPSRQRAHRCIETIKNWRSLASSPDRITMLIGIHRDDETMNKPSMLDVFRQLGCIAHIHDGQTKVQAMNAGVADHLRGHEILILAADDMRCTVKGWDERIRRDMAAHWPNLDGALFYNDGHQGARINTLPVMGVNLWRKFGYFYHPAYASLFCDNEYQDVLQALNRLPYFDDCIIEHCHPIFKRGIEADALLAHTDSFWDQDKATYERRKPTAIPRVVLSIGMVSLAKRTTFRNQILDELNRQIEALPRPSSVEIVLEIDAGELTTGAKRNRVLDRAVGVYISFVDDDDMVSPTYVSRCLLALAENPDCLGISGIITTDGAHERTWQHSIDNGPEWREEKGVYLRPPTHVNPVRLELARAARFPDITHGEDRVYSERLFPLLKTQGQLISAAYDYRYRRKNKDGTET